MSIDTSVLISMLLPRTFPPTPVHRIAEAMFTGAFRIRIPETTRQEVLRKVRQKPWLTQRIPDQILYEFLERVEAIGTIDLPLENVPLILRDPNDNFLIAHARAHNVDVLISSDKDVLAHKEDEPFLILSPAAFIDFLATRGLLPPDEI